MDEVREDMQVSGAKELDAEDRKSWKEIIHCGNP